MECLWQVEREPSCLRVLERHWPNVKRVHDVKKAGAHNLERPDVICFGWPCVDLSVAGARAGISGERSGLFFEAARIIAELRPKVFVAENVPGLLSSWTPVESPPFEISARDFDSEEEAERWASSLSGECELEESSDFERVLLELSELGYGISQRVLDSQFYGVAQRRERVFIVGSLRERDGVASSESREEQRRLASLHFSILFDEASCDWDSAPSRPSGQGATELLGSGAGEDSNNRVAACLDGSPYADREAEESRPIAFGGNNTNGEIPVATALNAHGGTGRLDFESETFVVGTMRSNGDAHTGFACDDGLIVEAGQCQGSNVGPVGTLRSGKGDVTSGVPFVTRPLRSEGADASEDGTGRGTPLVAVPYNVVGSGQEGRNHAYESAVTGALQSKGNNPTGNEAGTVVAFESRFARNGRGAPDEIAAPLKAESGRTGKGDGAPLAAGGFGVRRLTPTECERLQNFPDGWTAIDAEGKEISDSARYRMLGNAVTVSVARWIAERIVKAMNGEL